MPGTEELPADGKEELLLVPPAPDFRLQLRGFMFKLGFGCSSLITNRCS